MPKAFRYTTIFVLLAMGYAGWIFFSRWHQRQEGEKMAAAQEAQRTIAEGRVASKYLDGGMKILNFYADPANVVQGARTSLCYGVRNAKTVSLEPSVPAVDPSISRCVEVKPARTTKYTLTAEGLKGEKATASLVVHVQ